MDATETSRKGPGLDEMTVGAPKSAREAFQSGAISLEALRAAHQMRDWRSALDVLGTLASFVAVPVLQAFYDALGALAAAIATVLVPVLMFPPRSSPIRRSTPMSA